VHGIGTAGRLHAGGFTIRDGKTKMQSIAGFWAEIAGDGRGVTALEYGLITGLVAVVILGAVSMFGHSASTVFTTVANSM
jgi:pilus assembly protein Flp/PilA